MISRCKLCGELFVGDMLIQDETWNTDMSDEQATLKEAGWFSDDSGIVLCEDCVHELYAAGYDPWGLEFYKEDKGIDTESVPG